MARNEKILETHIDASKPAFPSMYSSPILCNYHIYIAQLCENSTNSVKKIVVTIINDMPRTSFTNRKELDILATVKERTANGETLKQIYITICCQN